MSGLEDLDTETGCQFGECLECPLPDCKYCGLGYLRETQVKRLKELGWRAKDIAIHLGITHSYVCRLVKSG